MRQEFGARHGLYRREGRFHLPGTVSHLWPFARALVGALDLAGVPDGLVRDVDAEAEVTAHLAALERYWEPRGPRPAYSSDVIGTRLGGDRYYDDNAWVGLALVQRERMHPGAGVLERAAALFTFAVGGWDDRPDVPSPGGVFWVEQGRGAGRTNHDRNTVSTAPNAQLGLHLSELGAPPQPTGPIGPQQMYAWVNGALDDGSGDEPGTGLFWDKIRGDGSIDRALWSYNQGNMIGLNVLLARAAGGPDGAVHLSRAEAIARRALRHYEGRYESQPAAFNAILFRNLLQLHAATPDESLRAQITAAMRGYADHAWTQRRDRQGRFRFAGGRPTLLDQSGLVQVLALLAWDPADYRQLA